MEDRLQEQVAELVDDFIPISPANRGGDLVGLLNEMFHETLVRLLRVPGATARTSQQVHDAAQPVERRQFW